MGLEEWASCRSVRYVYLLHRVLGALARRMGTTVQVPRLSGDEAKQIDWRKSSLRDGLDPNDVMMREYRPGIQYTHLYIRCCQRLEEREHPYTHVAGIAVHGRGRS